MYTLLSGLYKYVFQKDEYCILILGLDNAGKTTFLEQSKTRFSKNYKGMSLSKITTTVGLNSKGAMSAVGVGPSPEGAVSSFEATSSWWAHLRSTGAGCCSQGSGETVMDPGHSLTGTLLSPVGTVDVGKARLMFWDLGGQEELQSLWDKYYAECHGVIYVIDSTDEDRLSESKQAFEKMVMSEALDGVPILVLANKQDVETCLSIPDIKTAFSDCTSKIGRRDCLTQACSALTGKGVREGIEWMVKCVVRNVHRPPRQRDIT
uniref:ADP-ribosylation factor-related protein 1 n=1 Tax=Myotis myotis TaxID=51298 RepID=A0A7J7VX09_MYOMY|nr:ADP ribosylation factor related protein 1 [Myotis myotis]